MPNTEDDDPRKALDQEAERKRQAAEPSADDKGAVKEPESGAAERQAGKIIGNG